MPDEGFESVIRKPITKSNVVIERGPVADFAAVCDEDPIYRDFQVAKKAGFDAIRSTHLSLRHGQLGPVPRRPAGGSTFWQPPG
ncbi:MAG: hypothetical protein ABSH04_07765 [Acidimicrobiales bacterium]